MKIPEEGVIQEGTPEMEETPFTQSTQCEHYLVLEPGTNNIAVCNKGCGHGQQFDPRTEKIVNGRITVY